MLTGDVDFTIDVSARDIDRLDATEGISVIKQKTAYAMLRSLVGSEMCIRDRFSSVPWTEKSDV